MLRLWALLAVSVVLPGQACVSSGVCGGSSCYTPPPVQCNPSSCQPGYSCGHYGCARNRARSSLTQKNGIVVPVEVFVNQTVPTRNIFGVERHKFVTPENKIDQKKYDQLTNPNYLFRQCCEDRRLPDACLHKCHFNVFSKNVLQSMFFKNDPCPIEAAADIQYCAAQGRDHRECCHVNGVQGTLAGEKCLTFCDQRPDKVVQLDYSFLPCYDRFETIKRCFYDEIKNRMEEKLAPHLEKN
ncbi:unnamed protein product [Bursaphelenchus xylophilus]|uniref:(pine wood nematode) hypothetical protein n=1 Tax=Bursaphelenchus xylophilus TaxID=6326 RepID=A0A1I7SSZ4_BURXY|nr:unnamed protein product [Bursaphelenchus xylophilus]CAG9108828.1 unnamed protein product [Bursaphelenchus xylophilus]